MPKFSVIMPSFNHEPYISESIRSVLTQTVGDLEFIMVDEKGVFFLLRASAGISDDFPDWRLRYIGTGEDMMKLKREIERMGIRNDSPRISQWSQIGE